MPVNEKNVFLPHCDSIIVGYVQKERGFTMIGGGRVKVDEKHLP